MGEGRGNQVDGGVPGRSAAREHERRRSNREARVRADHPLTGGLRLALGSPPQHEQAWATGAAGEMLVAESLAKAGDSVVVLHDRRLPRGRANIDHLAVAPSGVWVIDAKNLRGKVTIERPFRKPPKLVIAGRDRTSLIDGLDRQVRAVREVAASLDSTAPVHGALCFIEADLPLLRTLTFGGYPLLWRKGMRKKLRAEGPLNEARIAALAGGLARAFPSA